jgi:hypothetical protein
MHFDKRRCRTVLGAFMVACLAACQSRPSDDAETASAAPPQPTDSVAGVAPGPTADTTASPTDSVVVTTDKVQYRAGESMTLSFENRSASSYAFNPCTRTVERDDSGTWTTVPEPNRICTMEAWILDPRGTRSGPTELPTPLTPGRYRVAVRMTKEPPGGGAASAVVAVSRPIEVRAQ